MPSLVFVFIILATSNRSAAAYAAYILSAYALAISVVCVVRHARQFRRKKLSFPIIQKIRGIPVGDRILSDDEFRSEIVMYAGLCINILHASIEVSSELGKGSVFTVKLHRGKYEQD